MLVGSDGQKFLKECKSEGKEVTVWTVNDEEEMRVAAGWEVKAILTDKVKFAVGVRKTVSFYRERAELRDGIYIIC